MIILPTRDPSGLLSKIKNAIETNKIRTWTYDNDGDFTHSNPQWAGQAWLRPSARDNSLHLYIIPPENTHISKAVYAVYHGRFIEMVIRHFDDELSGHAAASPNPEELDEIR